MPLLLLVVAGLVLILATSYTMLGWALLGLGVGLFLLWLAFVFGVIAYFWNQEL